MWGLQWLSNEDGGHNLDLHYLVHAGPLYKSFAALASGAPGGTLRDHCSAL